MAQLSNLIVAGQTSLIGDTKAGKITADSFAGNADSATILKTSRTIGLSTGATGTPTNFNGSGNILIPVTEVKESYLSWGGKNFAGNFGPLDAAMIPDLGADRFAFGKPAGVTVEYSTDAGNTWTDYGATDAQKKGLFGTITLLRIGKNQTVGAGDLNKQLRITINTKDFGIYTKLNKFAIYLNTNGSTDCWCSIDRASESTPITWVNAANKVTVDGWPGWNIINVDAFTYGSYGDSNHGRIRFTFGCNGTTSGNYSGLYVQRIMAFGGVGWTTPSTMALKGTIYDYDSDQNVTFPAKVKATSFEGTATTATKLGTATVGSKTKPIYLDAGAPKASDATVGSRTKPVYLQDGVLTACSRDIPAGTTLSAAGSKTQPIYINSSGVPELCTAYTSASVKYATSAGTATRAESATSAGSATNATNALNIHGDGDFTPNDNLYLYFTKSDSPGYKRCYTSGNIRAKDSSYSEIWIGNGARGRLWIRGTGRGGNYLVSAASSADYTTTLPSKTSTLARNAEPSFDEDGNIIPSENPINLGTLTYSPDTAIHPLNQPVAMNESEIIPMTETIGSNSFPMYLSNGLLERSTDITASKITIDSAMLDIEENGEYVTLSADELKTFTIPLIKDTPTIYDVTTEGDHISSSPLLSFYAQPNEGYNILEIGASNITNLSDYGLSENSLGALNLSGGKHGQTTLYAGIKENLAIASERSADNKGGITFLDHATAETYHIPMVKWGERFNPDVDLQDAPIGSIYYEVEGDSKWKTIKNTYIKTE